MLCLLACVLATFLETSSSADSQVDYVITLNSTNNATVYCFSNYLAKLKLETVECAECKTRVRGSSNCTRTSAEQGRTSECRCNEECKERDRKCPVSTAGEHSTCLTKVKSRETARGLVCTGLTEEGGNLTINILIVRQTGSDLCYGAQSGTPLNESHLQERGLKYQDSRTNISYWKSGARESLRGVSYKSPIHCINSSRVVNLDAGHLLGAGYTIGRKTEGDDHAKEHGEEKPDFEQFCKIDRPKLWKRKEGFMLGTVYQCNGSYHILEDRFPCLHLPPTSGFRLPSLENCSSWEFLGIVVAMTVTMVLCYTVLIACVKLWVYVCKCARTEKIDIPLALADSSTNSRTTLTGSAVVKQESRDSVLSGVAMPPIPAIPSQQPTLSEGNEQTTPVTPT